jgi:acyl-homoserine lactone acylase PvdQ
MRLRAEVKMRTTYFLRVTLCIGVGFCGISLAGEVPAQSRIVTRGLDGNVEILIDHWGVPHICSATHHDTFFAQGWNVARDRLWQIDLGRRSGLGELSEVLGGSYIAQDRAIRLFVYRGDMDKEWEAYGPRRKRRYRGLCCRHQRLHTRNDREEPKWA